MKSNSAALYLALAGLVALAAAARPVAATAQHSDGHGQSEEKPAKESAAGHSHEMAEVHGGSVTMTPTHHFELLSTSKEARLYIYDDHQVPIMNLAAMKASMVLQEKAGKPMTMPMTYVKPDVAHGRTQGYFVAAHDFSGAEKNAMKATFTIEGLAKIPAQFKSSVSLGEPVVYTCPMHSDVMGEDPGKCGKCGMNLEKAAGHEGHDTEKTGGTSGHNHGNE